MTPQEQQLLQGLTDRVNQTQLTDKDPEAEQFIFQNLGKNSDSLYILAQTVLVQQYALDNATKQLADLKQQLTERNQQVEQLQQQPVKHTSFLGSLLGTDDRPAPPPPPPPQYQPVQYTTPPPYGQQYAQPVSYGYGQPQYGAPQGGGFLRGAMQTAAGVAAGAIAFEGIESLMHGFGQHAGYGSGYGSGFDNYGGGGRPEEIVNNNYYGDSNEHDKGDLTDRFQAAGDTPSPDVEDRRDAFADSSSDNDAPADDTSQFDDSSNDFSDDSSSFDSGGGSDDNS